MGFILLKINERLAYLYEATEVERVAVQTG
jgi:hypothetical protein